MDKRSADFEIYEDFRFRRAGGWLLILVSLPLTLIWALVGVPPRFNFADLVFLVGGPGMLLSGLWVAFPRRAPGVKMTISADKVTILTRRGVAVLMLDDLVRIKKTRPIMGKFDRLTFETEDGAAKFDVIQLTREASDIINLISIRLEQRGKFLKQGRTDVLGALNGIWDVRAGDPFEQST
ncbi:MAG: hypothetical protein AAFQ09_01605 [Pseudomonadota bacterium]